MLLFTENPTTLKQPLKIVMYPRPQYFEEALADAQSLVPALAGFVRREAAGNFSLEKI